MQVYSSTPAPDLQVTEMKYATGECAMYYRVMNKSTVYSSTSKIWVGHQDDYVTTEKTYALAVPAINANGGVWVKQPMMVPSRVVKGQMTCGMNSVKTVRTHVNARYTYKYVNGLYTTGTLLSSTAYAPSGWYVAEPSVKEKLTTNNALTLTLTMVPKVAVMLSY